jgi:hypothetical protein
MPNPWSKRQRNAKELKVFNLATTWSGPVKAAIQNFNNLGFGVKLVEEKDESSADIVVVLASGAKEYPHATGPFKTLPSFKPDQLHGQCSARMEQNRRGTEIFFAVIFLPGLITRANDNQKMIVVVHEFIHAAGLNEKHDHDSQGIMFSHMKEEKGGLIEYLHDKGAKPMPAIRVGAWTMCTMKHLWEGSAACEKG